MKAGQNLVASLLFSKLLSPSITIGRYLHSTTQDNGTKIDSLSEKRSWRLEMNNAYPVTPLKASTGTHDDRIHPFLPNPDSNVSGYFTISPHYGWDFQVLQSAARK